MEFGNLKQLGPIVLGLSVSESTGMYVGHLINARSGDTIALCAIGGVALYFAGHYLWRNREIIHTKIYSSLYKLSKK